MHAEVRCQSSEAHLVEAVGVEQIERRANDERAALVQGFRRVVSRAAAATDSAAAGGSLSHNVDN
jgi:hypothetical protein